MKTGWTAVSLGEACETFTDGDWIETKDQAKEGIRLLQTGNVGAGYFKDRGDKARFINEATFRRLSCTEVFPGDILVSRLPDPVGRACIVPDIRERMITAVDCAIIRTKTQVLEPNFLTYFMQSADYLRDVDDCCTGTTRKRISRKNLAKISVPLPPLEEQRRIVAVLDEAFEGLARARANVEANLVDAKALDRSTLDKIFVHLEATIELQPLERLCSDRGITYGVIKLGSHEAEGVPCLRTSNVRRLGYELEGIKRISPELSKEYSRTVLRGGEVLVNVRGTLGGVAPVPEDMAGWNISREVAMVDIDRDRADPKFVALFVATSKAQEWLTDVTTGAAHKGINLTDLRLLPIPCPSRDVQCKVVEEADRLRLATSDIDSRQRDRMRELESLQRSLLFHAFAGELT